MFDPTIFDNLKTVLEGAVYDLDFAGEIRIVSRADRIDLSVLNRTYAVAFTLTGPPANGETQTHAGPKTTFALSTNGKPPADGEPSPDAVEEVAEIELAYDAPDWSAEVLQADARPGCRLQIRLTTTVSAEDECRRIEKLLESEWGGECLVVQTLSFSYGAKPQRYRNEIAVQFGQKFDESIIDDLPGFVRHVVRTLRLLSGRWSGTD